MIDCGEVVIRMVRVTGVGVMVQVMMVMVMIVVRLYGYVDISRDVLASPLRHYSNFNHKHKSTYTCSFLSDMHIRYAVQHFLHCWLHGGRARHVRFPHALAHDCR